MATNRSLSRPHGRTDLKKEIWRNRYFYLMLLLPMAFFIIFKYLPLYGLQLAFKEYMLNKGITGSPWIGFDHFKRMTVEPEFFVAFKNTIIISLYRIIFGFPVPIILALMINEVYFNRFRRFTQTILTFPHFLSWVIVSGLVLNMFGDSGVIKKLVALYSPEMATNWNMLYSKASFRSFLIITDIWKEAGWGTIIYLAAIAGIDPSYYEAATIDGCNRLQKVWHITIPGIMGIIVIQLLLRVGWVMEAGFDQIFNLYTPPVYPVADILDTYVYRITFGRGVSMDMGFPTAVGLFKNVINFALIMTANAIARRAGHDGII
ncbi:MAG: ABC transporter permease [Caldicoprobacterales bacterium]|jgi:putative aldouronate transport system permease protein|nr:sugar ABC transporter permease [Clostridiales bacterium]